MIQDVIEGYYDPKKNYIYNYESGNEIRQPEAQERDWIMMNCRVGAPHGK
jgi:hypothetical protein